MGSKSGSAQKTYNIFGSGSILFGHGPHHTLHGIYAEGKILWEGTITRGAETYIDLTSLIDGSNFGAGGWMHFYWGTRTQTASAFLAGIGKSAMKGYAHLDYYRFLFGRERRNPRDIKLRLGSLPQADTSLVAAEHNILSDGQCNPVAAMVELGRMLGLPVTRFHAASWQAAAAAVAASEQSRLLSFCSPKIDSFEEARAVFNDLAAMVDAGFRWNGDLLEIVLKRWGEDPGELPIFDARHWTEGAHPSVPGAGMQTIPTSHVVAYVNRDKLDKDTTTTVPNAWARKMRGGDVDRKPLQRPHVMRKDQASAIGAQANKRATRPAAQSEIPLRSESIAVRLDGATSLLPGDKARFDLDPVPGGAGVLHVGVIEERADLPTGEVRLKIQPDTLTPATPYTPQLVSAEPQDTIVQPIEHALAIPLPPAGWGLPLAIGLLATRPQHNTAGCRVYFDSDEAGDFPELGQQTGFAARATLALDVDADADVLRLTLADGATAPDAYLTAMTPESEIAARADVMLAVIANVDVNGRVVVDGAGVPELEFCSIVGRTAVAAATHDYSVLRARRGLSARAWTGAAAVWIVPLANIVPWRHPDIPALLVSESIGHLRLAAYTGFAEDDVLPLPALTFAMPGSYDVAPRIQWTTPSGSSAETDTSGNITIEGTVTDRQGDLSGLRIDSRRNDGSAETTHLDQGFPATGSRDFSIALTFAGDATAYRLYTLRIEARDQAGFTTVSTRTITRPPTGTPATPPPPSFSPPSDTSHEGYLEVLIEGVSPATQVHWSKTVIGASAPGTWTVGALALFVPITGNTRLWARASDGTSHSPAVYADYYRSTNPGGGYIER